MTDLPVQVRRFTDHVCPMEFDPNGTHIINSAYVKSYIPAELSSPYPVVLLHGGGMSGAMWETTPDGRDGWMNMFIDAGYATYVMDNVGRGRAGWPAIDMDQLGSIVLRTQEEAWTLFRFGEKGGFPHQKPFPWQRFPVDKMSEFSAQFVPRWLAHRKESAHALTCLLEKIGPAIVVVHSQGGEAVFDAVQACPSLINKLVLVEPSAFPTSAEEYSRFNIQSLLVVGDYLNNTEVWRDLNAQYQNFLSHCLNVNLLDTVSEVGPGFSHMIMMDDGNDVVFRKILAWLKGNVPKEEYTKQTKGVSN